MPPLDRLLALKTRREQSRSGHRFNVESRAMFGLILAVAAVLAGLIAAVAGFGIGRLRA